MVAEDLVGVPYKPGGLTLEEGLDCYGLVRMAVQLEFGVWLPPEPGIWRGYARLLEPDEPMRRGDVLFFDSLERLHVGFVLGDGNFVHAMKQVAQVVCEPVSRYRDILRAIGRVHADRD